MNADLANFIWELCLLPHKVKHLDKDKFQACLLGMEDMSPSEFWRIFDLRPGLEYHRCSTCKWFMSGACYHPFMPMKMIDGIFSSTIGRCTNEIMPDCNPELADYQEVDNDNVCNEWTPQNILDGPYNGLSKFIEDLLERNLESINHDPERYWNALDHYFKVGYGDEDSKEIKDFFKNWIDEVTKEFVSIRDEKYEFDNGGYELHQNKINAYKDILRFELFTFWMRRPNFNDPLERYNEE